jgi:hypothetical protein
LSVGGHRGHFEFVGADTETPWNLTFKTSMNPEFFGQYINPNDAEDDDSSRSADWLEDDSPASVDEFEAGTSYRIWIPLQIWSLSPRVLMMATIS